MPSNTPPDSSNGLSDAIILAQRIQSGENVPLEELISFLQTSGKKLDIERKLRNSPPKPKDVDFF